MESITDKSECIVETRKWPVTFLVDEISKKCLEILGQKAEKFWKKLNVVRDDIYLYLPYWKNWVSFTIKFNQKESKFEFIMDHPYSMLYQKYATIDDFQKQYELFINDIMESNNFDRDAENASQLLLESI